MRPRFVTALCMVALLAAAGAIADLSAALAVAPYRHGFLGLEIGGLGARLVAVIEPLAYIGVARGLWRLRPWARLVTMAYLALVILSFLFVGTGSRGEGHAVSVMLWQVSVLPFATFCFMFLYGGRRHFVAGARP